MTKRVSTHHIAQGSQLSGDRDPTMFLGESEK